MLHEVLAHSNAIWSFVKPTSSRIEMKVFFL